MTYRELKEKFENKDSWGRIDNCELSGHTRWSRINIFDESINHHDLMYYLPDGAELWG